MKEHRWFILHIIFSFIGEHAVARNEQKQLSTLESRNLRTNDAFDNNFSQVPLVSIDRNIGITSPTSRPTKTLQIAIISVNSALELPHVTSYMDDDVKRIFDETCRNFLSNIVEERLYFHVKIKNVKTISQLGVQSVDGIAKVAKLDTSIDFDRLIVNLSITCEIDLMEYSSFQHIIQSIFVNKRQELLYQLDDIPFFHGISSFEIPHESKELNEIMPLFTSVDILSLLIGIGVVIVVFSVYISNLKDYNQQTWNDNRHLDDKGGTCVTLSKEMRHVPDRESSRKFRSLAQDREKGQKHQLRSFEKVKLSAKEPEFISVGNFFHFLGTSKKKVSQELQLTGSSSSSNSIIGRLHPSSAFTIVKKSRNQKNKFALNTSSWDEVKEKNFRETKKGEFPEENKNMIIETKTYDDISLLTLSNDNLGVPQEIQCLGNSNGLPKLYSAIAALNKCTTQHLELEQIATEKISEKLHPDFIDNISISACIGNGMLGNVLKDTIIKNTLENESLKQFKSKLKSKLVSGEDTIRFQQKHVVDASVKYNKSKNQNDHASIEYFKNIETDSKGFIVSTKK